MPDYRLTAQVRDVTSGSSGATYGLANVTVATTGTHEDRRVVEVGTSEEEYTFSTDVGDAGLIILLNKDDTNYVQLGYATGVYVQRLQPGRPYVFDLEPTIASIFMKANTAACDVLFHVLED